MPEIWGGGTQEKKKYRCLKVISNIKSDGFPFCCAGSII